MKTKIIPCGIFLLLIAALAIIFLNSSNNTHSEDDNDSEPNILKKIQTDYMDLNGEIWITEDSIQFNATNINGHDVSDFSKEESLVVYYKDGSSKKWTQDSYMIDGNNDKCTLSYSWVCGETDKEGPSTRLSFDLKSIEHIELGDSTIQLN